MNYIGFVNCRCYQDKKTAEPPYKDYVRINEKGLYLEEKNLPKDGRPFFMKASKFSQWKRTACTHRNMEQARAFIANEIGMIAFKNYVQKNGGEAQFPLMAAQLQLVGGSPISAKIAGKMLKEIQLLKKRAKLTSTDKTVLREKVSRRMVMLGDYDDSNFFGLLKNGNIFMIRGEEFFILDRMRSEGANYPVLFQAHEFYTQILDSDKVKYSTTEPCEDFMTLRGLGKPEPQGMQTVYIVEHESFNSYEFYKTTIDGFIQLFEAAKETGNPVVWEK